MNTPLPRYYFHGDLRDEVTVYCALCDLFEPLMHLTAHKFTENAARLRRDKRRGSPWGYDRPADAPNTLLPKAAR